MLNTYYLYMYQELNIPIIIQPHGMLLDEAIKAKSKFNYLIKLLIIKIYKQFLRDYNIHSCNRSPKKSILN